MPGKSRKTPDEWERVLIRHVLAARRDDVTRLKSLISPPFESTSSSSVGGGGSHTRILGLPRDRWLLAVEFSGQKWAALFCNCASSEEIVRANDSNNRLEIAHIGYLRARGGWFVSVQKAGKQVVGFQQEHADGSGFEKFQEVCETLGLEPRQRSVRANQKQFQVLGVRGTPVKSGVAGYLLYHGHALTEGESPSSDKLAKGIEFRNSTLIREAVAEGASLETLPESSTYPLMAALYKCGRTRWEEAAETLLELGCDIEGVPGEDPPIICATQSFVNEATSLGILEFLMKHGAQVDARGTNGNTALFDQAVYRRIPSIELLLKHGADPDATTKSGKTIVEWVKERIAQDHRHGYSQHAEVLKLLTGEEIEHPGMADFTEELQQENARFQECIQAKTVLAMISSDVEVRDASDNPLAKWNNYAAWTKELTELGFTKAGSYFLCTGFVPVPEVAYVHKELGFDAVLSLGGPALDRLRLELGGYHVDGTMTCVANVQNAELMEFRSRFSDCETIPEATPSQLVDRLKERIAAAGKACLLLDVSSFVQRFREASQRLVVELREFLNSILKTPRILVDGKPPRFERVHCFLDIVSDRDPTWSTAKVTKGELEDMIRAESAEAGDSWRLTSGIRAVGNLLMLQHLQYAGAPKSSEYLSKGSELAVRFFEAESRRSKPFDDIWCVEEFLVGLLSAMLTDRWDHVERLCESLKPKFATTDARDTHDSPRELAYLLLNIASHFRSKPVRGIQRMETQITASRHEQIKLLARTWDAVRAADGERFEAELLRSLNHRVEEHPTGFSVQEMHEMLAWPESILIQIALHQGLSGPELPASLNDRVLKVPE